MKHYIYVEGGGGGGGGRKTLKWDHFAAEAEVVLITVSWEDYFWLLQARQTGFISSMCVTAREWERWEVQRFLSIEHQFVLAGAGIVLGH